MTVYSSFPPRQAWIARGTVAVSWVMSAGAGVAGLLTAQLNPLLAVFPLPVVIGFSIGLLISAGAATFGILGNFYRVEWVAAWLAALTMMPFVVIVWGYNVEELGARSPSAFLLTSLMLFYVARATICAAHAAKLRLAHSTGTGVLNVVANGGESNDDGSTRARR